MSDLKIMIIGLGSIGKRHLRNCQQLGIENIIATDSNPARRAEVKEHFGIPVFKDLETAINHGPNVAVICTPTSLHLTNALTAAQAGCHLFIEKPIADSRDHLEELLKEVKQRKLITMVQCNFRFHPGMVHVKSLLETNQLGRIVSARAHFGQYLPDWHPWEDYRYGYSAQRSLGGGVILDRIHEIDYIRWLLGEIVEVYAMADHLSHLELDTEDVAEILLKFDSGALGSVHLDYVRRTYGCSLEITGDEGTIEWTYSNHGVRWYLARESKWFSLQWAKYDGNEMYLAAMQNFLMALQGKEVVTCDAEEGVRVLSIALAAIESAATRKAISL